MPTSLLAPAMKPAAGVSANPVPVGIAPGVVGAPVLPAAPWGVTGVCVTGTTGCSTTGVTGSCPVPAPAAPGVGAGASANAGRLVGAGPGPSLPPSPSSAGEEQPRPRTPAIDN